MPSSRFHKACLDIAQARDKASLTTALSTAGEQLGFERFTSFIAIDRLGGPTEFVHTAGNVPEHYRPIYNDRNRGRRDPVMQYLKFNHRPLTWDRDYYRLHARLPDWEEIACYGYAAGISTALHLPNGRHFAFGYAGSSHLPDHPGALNKLLACVHLLGSYAYEASARLYAPMAPQNLQGRFTHREIACLQWTAAGKTAWEVGHILHLSERTIAGLLANATRKLECVNKHQAVLRALQLGLIEI